MKQYTIDIKQGQPSVYTLTVDKNEPFAVLVRYNKWTVNKAAHNFFILDKAGNTLTKLIDIVKQDQESGDYEILHYIGAMESDTETVLKSPNQTSIIQPQCEIIFRMSDSSEKILNTSFEQSIYSSTASYLSCNTGMTVEMKSMVKANNKTDVYCGDYSGEPQVNIYDSNLSAIASIKGFTKELKNIGGRPREILDSGRTIELNPTKLIINGVTMGLKEITVGGETLSVLAAI